MKFDIIKMSSKGQIVVPKNMRTGIKEGDRLIIIKDGNKFIIRDANNLDEKFKEDLEFARRTEEAWERIKKGKGIKIEFDDFVKKMKKR